MLLLSIYLSTSVPLPLQYLEKHCDVYVAVLELGMKTDEDEQLSPGQQDHNRSQVTVTLVQVRALIDR